MKKTILLLLTFLMMIKIGYSQKAPICFYNFENPLSCFGDTLWIDTITNHNNVWQIGQPFKTTLGTAYSMPNAIVTKLNTFYPTNDTSTFILAHSPDWTLVNMGAMWIKAKYQINSDTLSDYGTIEFSPNNGGLWINLLTDTLYAQQNLYNWPWGKPIFSGNSSGWQSFEIWITDNYHVFNIQYGDTVLWRFTFISDSNQTNKDGWMLDDIMVNDWYEGIAENPYQIINISPNPFSTSIQISFDKTYQSLDLSILDLQSKIIQQKSYHDRNKITLDRAGIATGFYFLRVSLDGKFVETKKIVID